MAGFQKGLNKIFKQWDRESSDAQAAQDRLWRAMQRSRDKANPHYLAVQAALKATAPVVAIPVEGHAPLCVKAKLLKNALKGVTVLSVEVASYGEGEYQERRLKITGRAGWSERLALSFLCPAMRL